MRFFILFACAVIVACTSSPPTRADVPAPAPAAAAPEPAPAPAPAPAAADAARAPAAAGARTPAVPKSSPNYDLFEGTAHKNACKADADCHVGGCSHEVCSADTRVMSSCIMHDDQPRDATCGCVNSECIWFR